MAYFGLSKITAEEIEAYCARYFSLLVHVDEIIVNNIYSNNDTYTTVFRSQAGGLYALVVANQPTALRDIKRVVQAMGLLAEIYLPPKADSDYFSSYAKHAYEKVYPSRTPLSGSDISYYQSLAPYGPGLVRIKRVNGEIRHHTGVLNSWRKVLDFSYNSIRVR